MKLINNMKNKMAERKENNQNKRDLNVLIKDYKAKMKKYIKSKNWNEGLELKRELEELEVFILKVNSKIKYRNIFVNMEKRKLKKEYDKKLDNLILRYRAMEKSIKRYEKSNDDFGKGKVTYLKAKIRKLEDDISNTIRKRELMTK